MGGKCFARGLLDTIYNELYGLTIGKVYSTEQLAYYNKANQFPSLIANNINGSISSVILPALSNEQDNKEKVKRMMRRAIKTSAFILFPIMFGLAAVAEPVIKIVLTDKWITAVPFLQLLCFSYVLWPIHTVNLQAISALGRSDIFLKLEVIKKIVGIIALIISIPFGIIIMVVMKIVTSIITIFINAYPNKKLLDYSIREQLKDISLYLLISFIMFIVVYLMNYIKINIYLLLILQIVVGMLTYIGISCMVKDESLNYIITIIKDKLKTRKETKI